MSLEPPKVFLSHASEDKGRFVLDFATKLRAHGVDVWLDRWEMLPGDSLVQKIFDEGLKNAAAVIVVLSRISVEKPWVRQELDTAFVKRVNSGSKLIPVVIDECELPEALKATLWERIQDLNNYEASFQRILAAVYGQQEKPPLGTPPSYVHEKLVDVGGLSKTDNLVLKLSCELAIRKDDDRLLPEEAFKNGEDWLVPEEELQESLEMLDRQSYISIARVIGPKFPHYRVTAYGFDAYARAYMNEYDAVTTEIISAIVNKGLDNTHALRDKTNKPIQLIEFILDNLEAQGHLKLSKMSSRFTRAYNVSPALRRFLAG